MENLNRLTIFDNFKATETYGDDKYTYYRSSDFTIPPTHVGLVELFTGYEDFQKVSFNFFKAPRKIDKQDCIDTNGVVKLYKQNDCMGDYLGSNTTKGNSNVSESQKSILALGWDFNNQMLFERRYITTPGDFYMTIDKEYKQIIEDCTKRVIVELHLIPTVSNYQVGERC